ncbi:MAG TPA: PQQ-binding-like beta-propeller repeat protein [Planctomycetaceae bacterium]|nr:PQQ-binding-like beta-propeller repeat protein [Planctomycetaceae bacterium]
MLDRRCSLGCFVLLLCPPLLFGADVSWPQWRGPDRNDVSTETGLLKEWPPSGPQQLWVNKDVGLGYSGVAIVGGKLFTMGARADTEFLFCLDVNDGSELWAARLGTRLDNGWGDGPRGTPFVDGDTVYAMGGQGTLVCATVADGEVRWRKTMSEFGGKKPGWGYCESVLVDGPKVVCTPGGGQGAIVAFNKIDGEVIWQSHEFTEKAAYSSVVPVEWNGQRQYVQLFQDSLVGIAADNGKLLWRTDWPGKTAVIPTPIYHEGHVFITSGYGVGCKLVKLGDANKVEDIYFNKNMKNHHGGVVLVGDHLYGHWDGGGWMCLDFKTGEVVWNEKSALGKGCLTCVDGLLYCVDERDGTVALVEASPAGWKEHGRFKLEPQTTRRSPKGRIWTHPVVCNGKLFLRDQELLSCYDVKAK